MFKFLKKDSGATAIEYALIAAATALAIVTLLPAISTGLTTIFTSIAVAL